MSRVEADLCLNTCGEIIKLNTNYTRRTVFNIQARCSPWMNIRQSSSKPRKGIRLFTLMDWPILDAICVETKLIYNILVEVTFFIKVRCLSLNRNMTHNLKSFDNTFLWFSVSDLDMKCVTYTQM